MERNIFIENTPVEEALSRYLEALKLTPRIETIAIADSPGRITARAVFATQSSPNCNQAAMDGIAVVAATTENAREGSPLRLEEGRDFIYVNTGNPINHPWDAVIMIEDVLRDDSDGCVRINQAAKAWQHIRPIGEDIVATQMLLGSGQRIRPIDMAAMLAGYAENLQVYTHPQVGVLPTGGEIVQGEDGRIKGKILDSNSPMIRALCTAEGASAQVYPVTPDQPEALKSAIQKAIAENDLVIINAGSSAGSKDYSYAVLAELGTVHIHGVAMKPGKPVILAEVAGKPVIGLPGYPVSSYLAFENFVKPVLNLLSGQRPRSETLVEATVARQINSSVKSKEYLRVNLGYVSGKYIATVLDSGAGVLMSLVKADGIGEIPREKEGLAAGDSLSVRLLRDESEIRAKLFAVGSHDLIMDLISDRLPLSSAHVGSMGGILALMRQEANLAPIHILDPESGEYNKAIARQYFNADDYVLIKGVERIQGFFLPPGNPRNIRDFSDLTQEGLRFANRQRGAGTRILLDYQLAKLGIDPNRIYGYERALTTHLAVASAVSEGDADVGLGVWSAAQALNLDFCPVGVEEYDFLLAKNMLEDSRIIALIALLQDPEFRAKVEALGGYTCKRSGEIVSL